jgi:hypothetical protein
MKSFVLWAALLLVVSSVTPGFAQSTSAAVSGTIDDGTGALIPGVTVTATNNATGVVTTVLSNEAGAYNFASLLPGTYSVSARLPGFQTATFTNVQLGNRDQVRLNFTLKVASVATSVEVSVAADTTLSTSSSSVGEVLTQQKVQDMPLVGNNVLDLLRLLPGARMNDDGVNGTFAGVSADKVNMQRDGVDTSGSAYWVQAGAQTATFINPDLVGEVRMILAPVDAELGRGNAQIQFLTRSGTNRYTGSLVWSATNSALDANTWSNNRAIDSKTGAWKPIKPNWTNAHEFTLSIGGPIVRNKTFFFALYDGVIVNARTTQNPVVLTPCARNGIFRYFDGWNNGNTTQTLAATGATPTIQVVDALGNPLKPAFNPGVQDSSNPFTGQLRYVSLFGPVTNAATINADCSNAQVGSASTPTGTWDVNRKAVDPTGFVNKVMGKMPLPNNYEVGDGLNTAGHQWTRSESGGSEGIFAIGGNLGRKQINTKIDHNFSNSQKLAGSYTYEISSGNAGYEIVPDGFRGAVTRKPQTLSVTFTSTLSPTLLNEARLGYRLTKGRTYSAFNNPDTGQDALAFFPTMNGYPVNIGLQTFNTIPVASGTATYFDDTSLWTYADTISWTKGAHVIKVGGELRRGHSLGQDAINNLIPTGVGGDTQLSAIPDAAISGTAIPGQPGTPTIPGLAGTANTGNNQRMRQLLTFFAGSLANVNQGSWITDPNNVDTFSDYKDFDHRIRDMHNQNEASAFFKDDWKVRRSLTLNLGVRWAYFAVPWESNGLMPLPVGGGDAMFGISGRSWDGWMRPGQRADVTALQFVGKGSPNPDIPWYPNDWNNIGPAVGFSWQVPWFGEGKTTVRGGYQMTYQINQSGNNIIQEINAPGSSDIATYIPASSDPYLDLTKLNPSLFPVRTLTPAGTPLKPMQPSLLTGPRNQQIYIPDAGLSTPYAQNLTLSVTRSVSSRLTVDLRYIGTLSRKQWDPVVNINQPNFLYNGLKEAFDAARAGTDSSPALTLLEDMFRGINVAGSGCTTPTGATTPCGPVGTTNSAGVLQTAAMHLRANTTLRGNLANGNYSALAASLNTLNYAAASNPTLPVIPTGVVGTVLRQNNFPENFIVTNPQFGAVNNLTNVYSNNYHSLETQVTMRPVHGVSFQTTYTWSKNLGTGQAGGLGATYTTLADRHADYSLQSDSRTHDFRTNGTFALPMGPNKLFLSNSSGTLARIVEGWQASWIVNLTSGQPMNIGAQNMLYANGTASIVGPFDLDSKGVKYDTGTTWSYLPKGAYIVDDDPQCLQTTTLQGLRAQCTIDAVKDASGNYVLQNPQTGTRGTLGQRVMEGPGQWRFDANLQKAFSISESKTLQFRLDARNILNHPEPNAPTLAITSPNFGTINGKTNLRRQFQAQLRFTF